MRAKQKVSFFAPTRLRGLFLSTILVFTLALSGCTESELSAPPPDPLVAGPYPVGVTRIELYDASRDRVLLTEIWYPAAESARGQAPAPAASYLPAGLEALAANATIPLVAVRDVPIADGAPFPLVEFSHGNGGIRFQNSFQMEHLASHGFIVAAPDHPGNTFFSNSGTQGEHAINRPIDMSFLADELVRLSSDPTSDFFGWVDSSKGFGITGHSFGAFTSVATASADSRFVAALPMALGGPVSDTYGAATLLLLATEDHTIGLGGNDVVRQTFVNVPPPRYIGEVIDAGHYSFSFACQTGLGIGDGDGCKTGTRLEGGAPFTYVSDLRVWDIVDGYSAALFGRYINGIIEYDDTLNTNLDPEIMDYIADPGRVMEIGVLSVPIRTAQTARTLEELGFDRIVLPDSQNLAPEVWGQLMLAAGTTKRVLLGPGVTNSITRDAAVTASAAAGLQLESGGRAVLGIGRGDSSVQRIGKHEDPVASFERYLVMLQAYLRGEAVDRDGFASRIEWLEHVKLKKVPVEVAATGRKVIEVAARNADAICFAVGADAEHVQDVLAHAKAAAAAAGRAPDAVRYGAFINCVVNDDVRVAREGVRGSLATFARFSAFKGSRLEALPGPLQNAARFLRENYDMRNHTRAGVHHADALPDDFVDWFGVAGPLTTVLPRLTALKAVGLDYITIIPGSAGMPREVATSSLVSIATAVAPALRAA